MSKSITIGQMRDRAYFLINNPVAYGAGKSDSYSLLLTTRCRIRKTSGGRGLQFGLIADTQTFELLCRFQSDIEDNLSVDVKIIIGGFLYTIQTWETVDNLAHLYKFTVAVEKQFAKNSNPIADYVTGATLFLTLAEGAISVQDDLLIGAIVLWTSREGAVYSMGTAANLVANHDPITGTISFLSTNPGNTNGEKIVVAYNAS